MTEPPTEPEPDACPLKAFDVYLIDSGWNVTISKAVKHNLGVIRSYLCDYNLYLLDEAQSTEVLRKDPACIGNDPILMFLDRETMRSGQRPFGFRLNLGLLRHSEQALAKLQFALRILSEHRTSARIAKAIRKEFLKEGIDGAFRAIGETTLELH